MTHPTADLDANQTQRMHNAKASEHGESHASGAHHSDHHVASMLRLGGTFVGLLLLTGVTIFAARFVDLGHWDIAVAMLIATAKAGLVAVFFMNLSHERGFIRLCFASALFFMFLFIVFVLFDTAHTDAWNIWQEKLS